MQAGADHQKLAEGGTRLKRGEFAHFALVDGQALLGVSDRTQAAVLAVRQGLVE